MPVCIKRVTQVSAILFFIGFPVALSPDPAHQRQVFSAATEALQEGRREQFRHLLSTLEGYPLYPYLIYDDLRQNLADENKERISSFMETYADTPLAARLENLWMKHLAKNRRWSELARTARVPVDEAVHCAYARSLMETGRYDRAWDEAEALWLHGRSRPGECDPVFEQWRKTDRFTPELVWQRIGLSLAGGRESLARYLKRYLPPEDQRWLDLWLELLERPEKTFTVEVDWSEPAHPMAENILHQAMGALIRADTLQALSHLKKLKARAGKQGFDLAPVEQELGIFLCLRKHREALEYVKALPAEKLTPVLRAWHIRAAIYHQDWPGVLWALKRLNDSERKTPRWTYWHARALEESGQKQKAENIYRSILGRQNYFSLLAAERLGKPWYPDHRPISAEKPELLALRRDPGIMRAVELFYLGRFYDARREWVFAMAGKNASQNKAAALLAHDMGFADRAIAAAAAAGSYDDLILRFPLSWEPLIQHYARQRNLDPGWLFALARQESLFLPEAHSPAGALGIMQIMPATGRHIAAMLGENYPGRHALLIPETNIRFGIFYLANLMDELQGSPVLATAAYNAGTSRVKSWLPEGDALPADAWIETIPYYETRNYVEKVFTYKAVYRQRLGRAPERLAALMPDVLGASGITTCRAAPR